LESLNLHVMDTLAALLVGVLNCGGVESVVQGGSGQSRQLNPAARWRT
jgi:hypothetical protein